MGDDGGEQKVRDLLALSEFTYENNNYKIIQNEKPSPETKTDFYILAENMQNHIIRDFKISFKKPTYSFIENKIQPHRIIMIYGENWSEIISRQISQINTIDVNKHWKKKKPEESLQDSINNFPLVNFKKKKIMLGWRYEIEQLDAPNTGKRLHSGMIDQDITSEVFWGDGCSDDMRDALVDGTVVPNSGIPDFILIKNPEDIKHANDVFSNIHDIREYAQQHTEMRASFISQYYRWSTKDSDWKTEGFSRVFAVWINWEVVNGSLRGRPVLDKPLCKTAGEVLDGFRNCLEKMNIPFEPNFELELLRGRLTLDTVSKG